MTTIIVFITCILGLFGIGVSVWSIITTRKKYYHEYIERKRNG